MVESQLDDATKSDADLVVHMGLPEDNSGNTKESNDIEQTFKKLYAKIEAAISREDPDSYAKGVRELSGCMKEEIRGQYRSSSNDLGNTMYEWANNSPYPNNEALELLKIGKNIVRRTNTLNNSSTPHGTGIYKGDPTDRRGSQDFGKTVADYVNRRGLSYITAQIVPGYPYQMEPASVFQVETTLTGYSPRLKTESVKLQPPERVFD